MLSKIHKTNIKKHSSKYLLSFPRVPELLFQPSMIGNEQAGLAETVDYVLKKCSPEDQNALVQVSLTWS